MDAVDGVGARFGVIVDAGEVVEVLDVSVL
jgi:hypothetical protein